MHILIVVAHPDPKSLTHAIATQLAEGIRAAAGMADPDPTASGHPTVEIADLAAEGFDPRWNEGDIALFQKAGNPPADVAAEHARLDRADALVLVYPVFWWSFPGLLKGWIDRVFTQGWAYEDDTAGGKVVKKLQRLKVHLVANGGADQGTMDRHGYRDAMTTQIDHGIFDFCGAPVISSNVLLASDEGYPAAHLKTAESLGRRIAKDLWSASR
jgi:NAD(P)H dehydrogenase (quinone)